MLYISTLWPLDSNGIAINVKKSKQATKNNNLDFIFDFLQNMFIVNFYARQILYVSRFPEHRDTKFISQIRQSLQMIPM